MKLAWPIHLPPNAGTCPYRLLDEQGHEIAWVNDFLDAQHIRQLSPRSLRAYAYDLLHFARWFRSQPQTLSANHRVHAVGLCSPSTKQATPAYAANGESSLDRHSLFVSIPLRAGDSRLAIPISSALYTTRSPLGYGRPHRAVAFGLRLKQPRRVI